MCWNENYDVCIAQSFDLAICLTNDLLCIRLMLELASGKATVMGEQGDGEFSFQLCLSCVLLIWLKINLCLSYVVFIWLKMLQAIGCLPTVMLVMVSYLHLQGV